MMLEVPVNKLFGALAGFFVASALIAGPVTNPASSTQFETGMYTGAQQDYTFRVGYVGDATMDRKLEIKSGKSHVTKTEMHENAVSLTLGVYNRFDVFARAGKADFLALMANTGSDLSISAEEGFKWTVGGSAVLWTLDNTNINVFGSFSRYNSKVDAVRVGAFNSGFTDSKIRMQDWNAGLGIAHTIQVSPDMAVVPTAAVKYSDAKVHFRNDFIDSTSTTLNRMNARENVGVVIGCGLYAGKTFALNIEGRFVDESAAAISAEIRL
jgi:hypothetical protein